MVKTLKTLLPLLLVAVLAVSCGDKSQKQFNRLLLELANQDETIDGDDWQQIEQFLDANKAHFGQMYVDGQISEKAVEDYITDFFAHRRPAKEIRYVGIGGGELSFRIYMERSGSMTPYDSPQGDGSFRAAVMALKNHLPGKVEEESIGEAGYTDFRAIFDSLLNKTSRGHISVLVTDLIYSVKDMQGVNPQRVFNEMSGMINAVFKEKVAEKAMLVVKMNGSYDGPYYSYDNSMRQFHGHRPYYIIVMGDNESILRLTEDKELRAFADFSSLRSYENMYLFEARELYRPYYSLLLSNDDIRGRFKPKQGQADRITAIRSAEVDPNSGDMQLAVAVDLSHMLIDSGYLTNPANYLVSSEDTVKIKEIRPITPKDATPAEKKYLSTATHIIVLSVGKLSRNQKVSLRLLNKLPAWVQESSSDNDLQPDGRTTFGLRYLMEGIYDSYKRATEGTPQYFDIELNIER